MRLFELSSPFAGVVASMVHASARRDPMLAAFHATFIATRLIGGALAVLALPVYLALWGAPDPLAVICFAWLAAPIGIALYLSRTGRLGIAHVMSASTLSGLVIFVSAFTGGTASPFLPWLIAVPAESALSGSGRVVVAATAIAAAALAGLIGFEGLGVLPAALALPVPSWTLAVFGVLPALVYAGVLAARSSKMAHGMAVSERLDRDRLRDLVDEATDVIMTVRRNGNVTFATNAARSLLATSGEALQGDGLFARIHVGDRPAYLKALDEAAAGTDSWAEFRVLWGEIGEDAGHIWVEMRCRPRAAIDGGSPDIVAVLSTVDGRKRVEGQLRDAHDEAEKANIAKGRFLASMSHELRTPLNAIIGFSEILTEGTGTDGNEAEAWKLDADKQREYARLIHESGVHLLEVVNDVLDMSKIETGNFDICPEPLDVGELIGSCCRMIEGQARDAGLRLETDLPHGTSEINADRRACKQIVLNLLSNAVKFSRPGGRIVVGAYRDDAGAAIYVADEGIGIARSDIGRLGAPFVQLNNGYDRGHHGTGLGLSVVNGLVSLHGGVMDIDSELGVGTRITIRLPQAAVVPIHAGDAADLSPEVSETIRLSA